MCILSRGQNLIALRFKSSCFFKRSFILEISTCGLEVEWYIYTSLSRDCRDLGHDWHITTRKNIVVLCLNITKLKFCSLLANWQHKCGQWGDKLYIYIHICLVSPLNEYDVNIHAKNHLIIQRFCLHSFYFYLSIINLYVYLYIPFRSVTCTYANQKMLFYLFVQ